MIRVTPEARLLAAPSSTYRLLAREAGVLRPTAWMGALGRLLLAAAIAGTGTAVAATGRISWSLALSGVLCWLPLMVLQLITAALVILPIARRPARRGAPVHPGTLISLFFHAHAPWSIWILGASLFVFTAPGFSNHDAVLATAIVPLAWTALIAFAYFREVLGVTRHAAIAATIAHQGLTAILILGYVAWAVQLWPRLVGLRTP